MKELTEEERSVMDDIITRVRCECDACSRVWEVGMQIGREYVEALKRFKERHENSEPLSMEDEVLVGFVAGFEVGERLGERRERQRAAGGVR